MSLDLTHAQEITQKALKTTNIECGIMSIDSMIKTEAMAGHTSVETDNFNIFTRTSEQKTNLVNHYRNLGFLVDKVAESTKIKISWDK